MELGASLLPAFRPNIHPFFRLIPFGSFLWKFELQSPAHVTGTCLATSIPSHKVIVHDRECGLTHEFLAPEDQYLLHTAEDQDISASVHLQHSCISCAVCVKSGDIRQPEALGMCISFNLEYILLRGPIERDGYALEFGHG